MTTAKRVGLQALIDAALPGALVSIETPEEYQGPFVIDKPLTLAGRGRLTPLWRASGVVLLIASPNVILKDLVVELAASRANDDLPVVIHLEGCEPRFQNSLRAVLDESVVMTERNLIHLGTVHAAQKFILPFEIDANSPFNQFTKMPPYLVVEEPRYNRHGARVFWLGANIPNEAGYIMDTLTMSSENGSTAQYLINGHVTDAAPSGDGPYMLKVVRGAGRIRNVYTLAGMLELSAEQISLITGTSVSAGRSLYIFTDDADTGQFIWLPFQTIRNSVVYDDVRVQGWKRYPLAAGKRLTLKQGDLEFEVAPMGNLTLQINPGGLDFGEVKSVGAKLKVEIKNNQGLIQSGLGLLKRQVNVQSLVDWLTVSSASLRLDRSGNELFVEINQNILNKTSGQTLFEPSALAIYDDNDVFFLPARVKVRLPEYAVALENTVLTFVTDDGSQIYAGEIPQLDGVGTLVNSGKSAVNVEVIDKPDWIVLSQGIDAPIRSGERLQFAARVLPDEANTVLNEGQIVLPDAIRLRCVQTNEVIGITLRIVVQPARLPNIRIEKPQAAPRDLNLDALERREVRRGEYDADQVFRRIRLKNYGMVEGRYRFSTSYPADLSIDSQPVERHPETTEITGMLAPSAEVSIRALYPAHVFRNEREGTVVNIDIKVETSKDGQTFTTTGTGVIPVNIVRRVPVASLSRTQLQYPPIIQNQDFDFKESITLQNTGADLFEGVIVVQPQYADVVRIAPVSEFRLKPTETFIFTVEGTSGFTSLPPGDYDVGNLVMIQRSDLAPTVDPAKGMLAAIGMHWMIERPDPLPYLHTPSLYFGRAEIGFANRQPVLANEEPLSRELMIGNYGHAPYKMRLVLNVPWLETLVPSGEVIEIPSQKVLRLPLMVNDRILDRDFGALYQPDGIELQALSENSESYHIPVRVLVVRLQLPVAAEPALIQLGSITAGQFLPASAMSAQFALTNMGRIDWHVAEAGTQKNNVVFEPFPTVVPKMSRTEPITVRWNDVYPATMYDERTTEEDLITLRDDNDQMINIRVLYDIYPPKVQMNPERLIFQVNPTVNSRSIGVRRVEQPQANLFIQNDGGAPFMVKRMNSSVDESVEIPGNLRLPRGLYLDPSVEDGYVIPPGDSQAFRLYAPSSRDVDDGVIPIILQLPGNLGKTIQTLVEIRS